MAKGYLVGTYRSVRAPERLAAYGELAKPALEAAGGRILTRGGRGTVFEPGVPERTVLVEFPSYAAAVTADESEDYRGPSRCWTTVRSGMCGSWRGLTERPGHRRGPAGNGEEPVCRVSRRRNRVPPAGLAPAGTGDRAC